MSLAFNGKADDDSAAGDSLGQNLIMIGQPFDLAAQRIRRLPEIEHRFGRSAVRLGEDDVEGDGRSPGILQFRHQFGDPGARPGPLPEPAQAFIVDVDDAHRRFNVDPRMPALKLVEHGVAQDLQRQRIPEIGGEAHGDREQGHEHADLPADPVAQHRLQP